MGYIEVSIKIAPFTEENAEIVMATIEELGFESFTVEEPYLKAYIQQEAYSAQHLKCLLSFFDDGGAFKVEWSANLVQSQNWNKEWESNFEPIVIDGECTIKADFHKNLPLTKYNIKIVPKMAFGTGHHQTTELMVKWILKIAKEKAAAAGAKEPNLRGMQVLDMGTGTGILAILAAKLGAVRAVHAIDVDIAAVNSARENVWKNRMHRATSIHYGDSSLIQASKYDLILANINRNILLEDMATYARGLKSADEIKFRKGLYKPAQGAQAEQSAQVAVAEQSVDKGAEAAAGLADGLIDIRTHGGLLVLSGFYTEDVPLLKAEAEKQGLTYVSQMSKDNWCALCFCKR